MKKIFGIIIKGLLFSFIPAIFTLFGTIDAFDRLQKAGYIGNAIDVQNLKNICSVLGVILTFLLLTKNLISHEIEEEKYKKQAKQLLKYNKDILVSALSEYLGKEYCNIDIRIFVPQKSICWYIGHAFDKNIPLKFKIKNIEGLADAGITNNLSFQVSPEEGAQGLVGECYQQRKIVYDENLQETNDTGYNLTDYQKSRTNDLKFIIVCPVFGNEKDIDAIVAFDCKHDIKIHDHEDKFINAILNYTQQLHEYVPELFKKEGGIF